MMGGTKIRVAVLYGGTSGEHQVSLRSAASVMRNLDQNRFEVVPVSIGLEGTWRFAKTDWMAKPEITSIPISGADLEVLLIQNARRKPALLERESGRVIDIDVVFPVLHGTNCEDGVLQGLLETVQVPYVGSGVLGSAVGMDKEVAKRLARDAGVPIAAYVFLQEKDRSGSLWDQAVKRVDAELGGYPVFVKPANSGSSVGVSKVKSKAELKRAVDEAFQWDVKVLIEQAISAREIEFSVLGSPLYGIPTRASIAGEIIPQHEFYSYEAKYLDENGAVLKIPSELTGPQLKEAQDIAIKAFEVLDCDGLARVDLFFDTKTSKLYFNEVNTMPGFTSISMYPKLWEASGLGYSALLSELIDLALKRAERRSQLKRSFEIPEKP